MVNKEGIQGRRMMYVLAAWDYEIDGAARFGIHRPIRAADALADLLPIKPPARWGGDLVAADFYILAVDAGAINRVRKWSEEEQRWMRKKSK